MTSGPSYGGTAITITGTNFTGATSESFGGVLALGFSVLSDTSIQAFAPAEVAGTIDVTVTTYSATSSTGSADHYTFNSVSLPTVSSLSTSSGSTAGGTLVTITGTGFTSASEVDFGGVPVFDFTVNSDTQISVLAPANFAGTVDVQVVNAAGTSACRRPATSSPSQRPAAPAVTSLGTSSGSTAGGTSVTITGTDFGGAFGVYFGTVAADFTVISGTSILATAPPNPSGTVDVTVATYTGTSAVSSNDHFTYSACQRLRPSRP